MIFFYDFLRYHALHGNQRDEHILTAIIFTNTCFLLITQHQLAFLYCSNEDRLWKAF